MGLLLDTNFSLPTPRLLLRDFVATDWRSVHRYVSDPRVVHYLPFPPQTEAGTQQYVTRLIGYASEQPRTRYYLAIVRQSDQDLIGGINLALSGGELGEPQQASFSYQLRHDTWGLGYATEAMQAILRFGFLTLGLHRISDFCDPANSASMRVMEKLGMRREGHLLQNYYTKGRWWDSVVYAILAEEWRTQQAPLA
jgi:RimJ/RimL family protein N-acetyltransferase